MDRLILDTGVLVEAVRGRLDVGAIADGDDVALAAISLAEFLVGVELHGDQAMQAAQRAFLDDLLTLMPIVDYTADIAREHAVLLAHVRRVGTPRGPHDLIIAATARATGRTVLTTDARADFGSLPGVGVRLI